MRCTIDGLVDYCVFWHPTWQPVPPFALPPSMLGMLSSALPPPLRLIMLHVLLLHMMPIQPVQQTKTSHFLL